mgnify:CR=1 FL=1
MGGNGTKTQLPSAVCVTACPNQFTEYSYWVASFTDRFIPSTKLMVTVKALCPPLGFGVNVAAPASILGSRGRMMEESNRVKLNTQSWYGADTKDKQIASPFTVFPQYVCVYTCVCVCVC